jgi:hypothetical protein
MTTAHLGMHVVESCGSSQIIPAVGAAVVPAAEDVLAKFFLGLFFA